MEDRWQASRGVVWTLLAIVVASGVFPVACRSKGEIRGNIDNAMRVEGGRALDVIGWAADTSTGAPVDKVEVRLNDKTAVVAQLGLGRIDVARTLGRNDFLKSGWTARIDLSGYPPGTYRVTALAYNSRGESGPLAVGKLDIQIP